MINPKKIELEKVSLSVCKILGLFVNTMTAYEKNSLLNIEILKKPVEMQSSSKPEIFSDLFSSFLKSRLNFEHFEKFDDPHSSCIYQITDSERRG